MPTIYALARLGVREESTFSRRKRNTMLPAVVAETLSWCGVLSGNSRFFCAEYCLWCLLALAWSWDAAELLHLSKRRGDVVMHSGWHTWLLIEYCYKMMVTPDGRAPCLLKFWGPLVLSSDIQ